MHLTRVKGIALGSLLALRSAKGWAVAKGGRPFRMIGTPLKETNANVRGIQANIHKNQYVT